MICRWQEILPLAETQKSDVVDRLATPERPSTTIAVLVHVILRSQVTRR